MPSRCRAFTIVQRQGHDIRADVHLPPTNGLTELVGHEFEHLIEQIEGLDLKRLARVKGSGVHEAEGRMFETDRAQAAGRVVAAEASYHRRMPAAIESLRSHHGARDTERREKTGMSLRAA